MTYHIIKNCPMCHEATRLNIVGWAPLYDRYGDGGVTSFAVQCANCRRFVSGNLTYPQDGPLMDENTLEKHADQTGNVSVLFRNNIEFDRKGEGKWYLWSVSPPESEINKFMNQVDTCMSHACYDAVALLCRKVVEITINKMIDIVDVEVSNSKIKPKTDNVSSLDELKGKELSFKIRYIFPPEAERGENRPDIYHLAQLTRLFGNKSAHENTPFTHEDAEDVYAFTQKFLRSARGN